MTFKAVMGVKGPLSVLCLTFFCSNAVGQTKNVIHDGMRETGQWAIAAPEPMQGPRFTAQVMGGYYVNSGLGPNAPLGSPVDADFDYIPLSLRFGYLLTSPSERQHLFRGVGEILVELMAAPVVDGFANVVVGPSLLLRYNFVQPNASIVPYIQGGAGLVYSDGYKTEGQDALGQAVEFLLQCQVGLRWMLNDKWSLDFEGGLQHISNANVSDHNGGINNLGASVGLTYYLPQFRRR